MSSPFASAKAIPWRGWSDQAFAAARSEGKPVLLALTATWCHWCHVMDQTTYSDPQVIALVNRGFIPVRVDVDQRPDLSARYNQGGFPSLALLDDGGQVISGRVYTPPDDMVRLLEEVSASYPQRTRPEATRSAPRPPDSAPAAPLTGGGATVDRVRQSLEELYDSSFGGFGDEPKQPPWEGVDFLLSLYRRHGERRLREMICLTLDSIADGLFDHRDGGFFRYSVARDWRVPHFEKMLYTNARLASTFLLAFEATGNRTYKDRALGTLEYLSARLRDPDSGLFYGSEDAEEEYYRLPWKDRDAAAQPSIDTTLYTGWNALAASAFTQAFAAVGTRSYLTQALLILEKLWAGFDGAGRGLPHVAGAPGGPRLLADHVYALNAFLGGYQVTGGQKQLERAEAVMSTVQELFGAPGGGFYDAAPDAEPGSPRLAGVKPVLENALLAEALVTLTTITWNEEYADLARITLKAFNQVVPDRTYEGPAGFRKVEEDEERLFLPAASAWARANDTLESGPAHLVVVGDGALAATKALAKAAMRAKSPSCVVQVLDPAVEPDVVGRLGFPANAAPAAYVCVGRQCLAPIHEPAELRRWTRPGALATLTAASQF